MSGRATGSLHSRSARGECRSQNNATGGVLGDKTCKAVERPEEGRA
ncbi:hypothetical protein [Streptomyces griseoflavus]